jgi:quercetin dioxygenase-like cupin family protein
MCPGDLVATGPNERHALQGIEESTLMVFTRGPRGGKEYESDTFRLEVPLIP